MLWFQELVDAVVLVVKVVIMVLHIRSGWCGVVGGFAIGGGGDDNVTDDWGVWYGGVGVGVLEMVMVMMVLLMIGVDGVVVLVLEVVIVKMIMVLLMVRVDGMVVLILVVMVMTVLLMVGVVKDRHERFGGAGSFVS